LLGDGHVFPGVLLGPDPGPQGALGEVVFTTSMGGYPEAITDPSYADQILVLSWPQAGIYGVPPGDLQSRRPVIRALVVRELVREVAGRESLGSYLFRHGVPVLEGIDTRALIRHLREQGTIPGAVRPSGPDRGSLPPIPLPDPRTVAQTASPPPPPSGQDQVLRVTVLDLGAKQAVLQLLARWGDVAVRAVGPQASVQEILAGTDAVLLSNGPGDPAHLTWALPTVRQVAMRVPTLGICLGHQLLAEAFGARTYKMRFGHRGINHPVQEVGTGRTWITSHNHGYAVDADSLPPDLDVMAIDLTDGTVEGIRHRHLPVLGIQFHPEGAPGPREVDDLLRGFLHTARRYKGVTA
jgi:carbamoyl-phosphate synthase small subunit